MMASGATLCSLMLRSRPKAVSSRPGASVVLAGASQALSARLYVTVSGCTPVHHEHSSLDEPLLL